MELDPSVFLALKEDYGILEDTMTVLISWVLIQYSIMAFFGEYSSVTVKHIDQLHTDTVSNKSTVVCLKLTYCFSAAVLISRKPITKSS